MESAAHSEMEEMLQQQDCSPEGGGLWEEHSSLGTMPNKNVGDHGLPLFCLWLFSAICKRQILLRNLSVHPFA